MLCRGINIPLRSILAEIPSWLQRLNYGILISNPISAQNHAEFNLAVKVQGERYCVRLSRQQQLEVTWGQTQTGVFARRVAAGGRSE